MKLPLCALVGLVLLALCLAPPARGEYTTFEVYPTHYVDPETAELAARAIVGESGSVIVDAKNRRLLVSATAEQHKELKELLEKMNVPPRNVRIDVQFNSKGDARETAAGVSPRGNILIKDGKVSSKIQLNPRLVHQTTETQSDVTQTLLVGSGKRGTLHVGEQLPYLETLMDYGIRWGYIQQRVAWQHVGARLLVEPTVIGDEGLVHIRITPELSGSVDGGPFHIEFAKAATEITVQSGETFSLGGLNKDESFYSTFLIGMEKTSDKQTLDILLTPHILDPKGARY